MSTIITLDQRALNGLFERLYPKLLTIAEKISRKSPFASAVTLINSAYVRLWRVNLREVNGETHFKRLVGRIMMHINQDAIRKGRKFSPLSSTLFAAAPDSDLGSDSDVRRALTVLATVAPGKATVIELFYFESLPQAAIAKRLDVSVSTVKADLRSARAWIHDWITTNCQQHRSHL